MASGQRRVSTNGTGAPQRVIARIDIKGPNVIKGIHLEGLRIVGKPDAMARQYYEQGADEIIYMDVVASLYGRNSILSVLEEAAAELFVPMTVGGGIRTIEDIVAALRSGADKVAINTAALQRPEFLTEAAEAFGRQCIVLSIEAKRRAPGRWEALTDNGRERTGVDVIDWVGEAEARGIGEVLVTSVDMEGTEKGFDIELVKAVRDKVSVPVIACGGAGEGAHILALLEASQCDAVCCASLFHYDRLPLPALKNELAAAGWEVRQ